MMHQNLDNDLNMALSREAMAGHLQARDDRGQSEAVREAIAQIVGAVCFLESTLGRDGAKSVVREVFVST
ncbi:hypothetical protein [Chelativorans alearense]|uniref:hypothetical protein n=1 Tax=Chelativorans alearense TaxID=2681495 RepID=UPI0013D0302A|nr:hypothetical protein [Chelativorans alearense]